MSLDFVLDYSAKFAMFLGFIFLSIVAVGLLYYTIIFVVWGVCELTDLVEDFSEKVNKPWILIAWRCLVGIVIIYFVGLIFYWLCFVSPPLPL